MTQSSPRKDFCNLLHKIGFIHVHEIDIHVEALYTASNGSHFAWNSG